jgi:hypothetical protein
MIIQNQLASLTYREIIEEMRGHIFDDFKDSFQQNTKYLFLPDVIY